MNDICHASFGFPEELVNQLQTVSLGFHIMKGSPRVLMSRAKESRQLILIILVCAIPRW
jgi:hypothetical protein